MRKQIQLLQSLTVLILCGLMLGCFGSSTESSKSSGNGNGANANGTEVKLENPAGDTSVSAEDGGPGFTGEGWTTVKPHPLGDPKAIKGGTMLTSVPSWPENLRVYGTGSNTFLNSVIEDLCYESLCELDANTLEFVPRLASHWKISDDKMTFTFRIDPRAHWSDGVPVTSVDVLATYELISDDSLVDPMSRAAITEKLNPPDIKSKYIFEVTCKEKDWRNFITVAGMVILPAHEITKDVEETDDDGNTVKGEDGNPKMRKFTGADYLKEYNFKYTATSGPYIVHPDDIKDNEAITVTRRSDYWGKDDEFNKGRYNIDKIRFVVVRDQRLSFDKAVKGELDFSPIYTAKWWVEDLTDLPAIEKGHLVKQKVYTKYPSGIQGLAFNMRKPPLDDVRVRKALGHLYDRPTMIEKFAYNEYLPLKSYYPGGDSENPENEMVTFDPRKAAELLKEAGWSERGDDGILVKDGKRLSLTISYRTKGLEKYYTSYKEDCKKAGVEINLSLLTPETQWKNQQERNFQIVSAAWGAILFPFPRANYHSKMADEEGSNNITGFKNEKADAIIEKYDKEFDFSKRVEMLKELDSIIFNEHSYALAWYLPCERILYLNKFGTPETVLPKYGDWRSVFTTWWVDPSKEKALKAATKSGNAITPIPPGELRPWDEDGRTAQNN